MELKEILLALQLKKETEKKKPKIKYKDLFKLKK